MARSIWKGAINFGLVSIPVRLNGATESKDLAFHLVHREDHSRLKQKRWCPVEDREVAADEIVRAYEYSKDRYVELLDEDLEKLPLPSQHSVELSSFVETKDIDPIYYEKSYYLEPEEMGLKPYALLLRVLESRKVIGIGKIALRNKERLCALRPMDGTLVLETLFYPDEIRSHETNRPDVLVSDKELAVAGSLVDALEEPFQPEQYRDAYRDAVMKVVEEKLQGQEVVEQPVAPRAGGKVTDLMAALRASVDAAREQKGAGKSEPAAKAAEKATPAARKKPARSKAVA